MFVFLYGKQENSCFFLLFTPSAEKKKVPVSWLVCFHIHPITQSFLSFCQGKKKIIVQVKQKLRRELDKGRECRWRSPDAGKRVRRVNLQRCWPCPSEDAGGSAAAEPASPQGNCSLARADLQDGPVATDPDSERFHFGAQPW